MNNRRRIHQVFVELMTPDAQKNDWFGWASGQMAHAFMGVIVTNALIFFLPSVWAFCITFLLYGLIKEVPDFFRKPSWASARDSLHDALFIASGSLLALAIASNHGWMFIANIIVISWGLIWGIYVRIK